MWCKWEKLDSDIKLLFLSAVLFSMTFFVFGPIQLYIGNIAEFWFTIGDMLGVSIFFGLFSMLVCVCLGLFMKKKARTTYIYFLVGVGIALYVQGNYVFTDYGVLDGREIVWEEYGITAIWNTLLWLVLMTLPCIIGKVFREKGKTILSGIAVFIILVQVVSLLILCLVTDFSKNQNSRYYLSSNGLNSISKNKNIIIFILDTFDQAYFDEIIATDSSYAEFLDGFTYFRNATCCYPTTKASVPFILTGQYYENEQPYMNYINEAYSNTDYYKALHDNSYDIGLYTSNMFVSDETKEKYVTNSAENEIIVTSNWELEKAMLRLTAFQYFPHIIKRYVWFYSGIFDELQATPEGKPEIYSKENLFYYNKLKEQGLSVDNIDGNTYRFIHIIGAHSPYELMENVTVALDGQATAITQAKASLNILREYIRQLKELEMYDNTMIIITADHGIPEKFGATPIYLVKRFDENGSMEINDNPVSHANIIPTILREINVDENDYGESVFEVTKKDNSERRYLWYTWDDSWDMDYMPTMTEYLVKADGNHSEDFILTGREYSGNIETFNYKFGHEIDFTKDGNSMDYAREGFSYREERGTWTNGSVAIQKMKFARKTEKNLLVDITLNSIFREQQYVTIYFNDKCVYSKLTTEKQISFIVPNEFIQAGEQEIRYEMSTGRPSADSNSGDLRDVSLCFESMSIIETDSDPIQEVTPINHYMTGDVIEFTKNNDGKRYFTKGLSEKGMSDLETDAVWSLGKSGQLFLNIGEQTTPLICKIILKAVYAGPQTIIIKHENNILFNNQINSPDEPIVFTIPQTCIEDGRLILDLEYPDAVSPYSRGESDDTREIAVMFYNIILESNAN